MLVASTIAPAIREPSLVGRLSVAARLIYSLIFALLMPAFLIFGGYCAPE